MSRLRPKHSALPRTKVLRLSGLVLSMICRPDDHKAHDEHDDHARDRRRHNRQERAELRRQSQQHEQPAGGKADDARSCSRCAAQRHVARRGVGRAPPIRPEIATQIPSAIRPFPMRRVSGFCQLSSLTFSHMTRLPNDFNAPQIDTITKVGSSDQRKLSRTFHRAPAARSTAPAQPVRTEPSAGARRPRTARSPPPYR